MDEKWGVKVGGWLGYGEAFAAVADELEALPKDEVLRVNLDVFSAATKALGTCERVRVLRDDVARVLPCELALFDGLGTYAKALSKAYFAHRTLAEAPDEARELREKALAFRSRLLADARALVRRGVLCPSSLRKLRGTTGYVAILADLGFLSILFRENFALVEGRCGVTREELAEVESFVSVFQEAIGSRPYSKAEFERSEDTLARAFTLFMRSYDVVRRAVCFLRWNEGDADEFAPSLYVRKRKRKEKVTLEVDSSPAGAEKSILPRSGGADSFEERRGGVGFVGGEYDLSGATNNEPSVRFDGADVGESKSKLLLSG